MMPKKKHGAPGWSLRRALVFPVVIWACIELHRLINAPDTRVNETIAYGWQVLMGVLVLGYTGFATVQDVAAIWRTGRALPYREEVDNGPAPETYDATDSGGR